MEVTNAVHAVSGECERLICAMGWKRPPNKDEAWMSQFSCRQPLTKIEPY